MFQSYQYYSDTTKLPMPENHKKNWLKNNCLEFIAKEMWHVNSRELDETRQVSSKRRRASSYWSQTPRSHLAGATSPALASGPEAGRLQAGVPCSSVTGWTSSSLPRRGYSPRCCRSRSPAAFLYGQVMQCPTHVQHVRRQKLCCSRDSCVEQSTIESTRRKTQFSELQAPAENSLVYCWPQRHVNNYLLRYRNTLTYLLTYLLTCNSAVGEQCPNWQANLSWVSSWSA